MKTIIETTNYYFYEGQIEGLSPSYFKRKKPNVLCGEILNQLETLTIPESELIYAYKATSQK